MKVNNTIKLAIAALLVFAVSGCNDADVASKNLSKDADNFKINRRVVFYNGITGEYMLQIEGFCSVDPGDANRMSVICKTGNEYKKHYLGKSDNVTWFAEQLTSANVSASHYKVVFKPSVIIPEPEIR